MKAPLKDLFFSVLLVYHTHIKAFLQMQHWRVDFSITASKCLPPPPPLPPEHLVYDEADSKHYHTLAFSNMFKSVV